MAIDVIIFTFYSDQLTIDVETGILTNNFSLKYCYENIIIFKFINGRRDFECLRNRLICGRMGGFKSWFH